MPKEILFTVAQDPSYNTTDLASRLEGLHRQGFEQYYDARFLESYITGLRQRGSNNLSFTWRLYNTPGHWMSQNVSLPNTVIDEPITLERVKKELEGDRFGYLVVSTYLNGYSTFREIAQYVRKERPDVKVIVGSIGALIDESAKLADFTLKGDQIHDLREIIGQKATDPLKVVTVRSDTQICFSGVTKRSSYACLVSSVGCMYGCDFCPVTAQYGTQYLAPFTAPEIKEAIISAHDQIAPGSNAFTVSVAEPQGLGNVRLWKEVFRQCRDLPFQCDLVSTTSSKIIQRYDLDELTAGALRLSTVNIGVESLLQGYQKNDHVDLKALSSRLREAGINVVSTFIIGFDWHTRENIAEEIKLLKDLGSSEYIVANLEMRPNSPLYNQLRREGRLLDVPPELLSAYGFQAYTHPHFAPGFNDMLPLLGEIAEELSDGIQIFNANLAAFLTRNNSREASKRLVMRRMLEDFNDSLNPLAYPDDVSYVKDKFAAELYYNLVFRQMDLFHPFVV